MAPSRSRPWIAGCVAWGLLLVAPRPPATAGPEPLEAQVLEFQDRFTQGVGAAELLQAAGFVVHALRPEGPPPSFSSDVVVLGSFASEHPAYREFLEASAKALLAFVERGGVLLQMTQSDQTELEPPFLPPELDAGRCDDDFDRLLLLAPGHPMLAGLPVGETGFEVPRHLGRSTSWESLSRSRGLRPLLATDASARRPALLEAAYGRGRILLSSLFLDKVTFPDPPPEKRAKGAKEAPPKQRPVAPAAFRSAAETFFRNLATYAALVREGKAPDVPIPTPAVGPPATVGWRLPRASVARYGTTRLASRQGKEEGRPGGPFLLGGAQLRPDGVFLPGVCALPDLAAILALSVPVSPDASAPGASWVVPLDGAPEVRVKGTLQVGPAVEGYARIEAEYAFASAPSDPKTTGPRLFDGQARVTLRFDLARGLVAEAWGRLATNLRTGAGREERRERLVERFEFTLEDARDANDPGFRKEVNAAIERGVNLLRTLQQPDGSFETLGDWKTGCAALALLTLSSCDVPLSDPALEKGLAWLCAQKPTRTYEMAVALMALDRAYTPAEEVARPESVPDGTQQRRLPADRRAWAEVVAQGLELQASSPGSWGYPPGPRSVVKVDTSNTQYGVLGLRAAVRLGIPVREAAWMGVVRYFQQVREREAPRATVSLVREGKSIDDPEVSDVPAAAGFRYTTREDHAWGSMTCAGISSLALARHALRQAASPKLTPKVEAEIDEMMRGAWAWLDRHWATDRHPRKSGQDWYAYYLYSLERAAILDRVKRVGGRDWYLEGALQLLARQAAEGSWTEEGGNRTTATCFALLFLRRATFAPPVVTGGG